MLNYIGYIKAIKLFNTENGNCSFQHGKLPTDMHIKAAHFFIQNKISIENLSHAAPRNQYVITLQGKLEFKVTDGSTFVLRPGIILIAEDIQGIGHSWNLLEGETWERIYIPIIAGEEDYFMIDEPK